MPRHAELVAILLLLHAPATTSAKPRASSAAGALDDKEGGQNFIIKGAGIQAREDGMKAAEEGRFADAVPLLERAVKAPPKRTSAELSLIHI